MNVDINVKSEYRQLIDYINKKSTHEVHKKLNKKEVKNQPTVDDIEIKRIKNYFLSINLHDDDKFNNAINKSIINDIINELSISKNFYTCTDIITCHLKFFYFQFNYEYHISENYVSNYIDYIKKTTYKNIILELAKFKQTNIFIDYKNKIKDIIPAIQDNIMIDFLYTETIYEDIYKLKALIYNINKHIDEKIKYIKVIKFNNGFENINFINIDFSTENIELFEKYNILDNCIKSRNKPHKIINADCLSCLYNNLCDKKINTNIKINKNQFNKKEEIKAKTLKPVVDIKHKFLL